MKLLLISQPSNPHTIKWANSLAEKGINVFLFGLTDFDRNLYKSDIEIEVIKTPENIKDRIRGSIYKSYYLKALPKLNKIIRDFKPDVTHAHYVSSNGVLAAMTNFHPFIISVWGYDIMTFPTVSFLHRKIIEFSLKRADRLCATSNYLASLTKNYTQKGIDIIPFGIDTTNFSPQKVNSLFSKDDIVVGTIKTLEAKYGFEVLIEAFSIVKNKLPQYSLKLLLIGSGTLEQKFRKMVSNLSLNESTIFTGYVPYSEVNKYHNMLDIEVYVSYVESFGVSVLEASSVENPVIVSDVGGLPEVVMNNKTGLIVPPNDPPKTAEAIELLIKEKELRNQLGLEGRKMVKNKYEWDKNLNSMIDVYKSVLK